MITREGQAAAFFGNRTQPKNKSSYRAYWLVADPINMRGYGKHSLIPLARTIKTHVTDVDPSLERVSIRNAVRRRMHVIRMDALSATEARVAIRETERFLDMTGLSWAAEYNNDSVRALGRG